MLSAKKGKIIFAIIFVVLVVGTIIGVYIGTKHRHNFSYDYITIEATCLNGGYTKHICECGDNYIDSYSSPKGHNVVIDIAIPATCTKKGKTEGEHCSRCNKILIKQNVIPATGHTDGEWFSDIEPTCTVYGSKHQICSTCNMTIKTESIPATGHADGEWFTDVEPTCTVYGSKHQVCSTCNTTIKTESIPATGHNWGDWSSITIPSCETDGLIYKECTTCLEKSTKVLPKYGHAKPDSVSAKEVDSEFFKCYVCLRCGNAVEERYNPIIADINFMALTGGANGWNFTWCVRAKYGFADKYQYAFIVTDKKTGKIHYWSSSMQDSNTFTFQSDSNDSLSMTNPLQVVVYISDGVGTVAYMFEMIRIYDVDNISIYQPYTLK